MGGGGDERERTRGRDGGTRGITTCRVVEPFRAGEFVRVSLFAESVVQLSSPSL